MAFKVSNKPLVTSMAVADAASWYCALEASPTYDDDRRQHDVVGGNRVSYRPCDEIYVVKEGETLHTISDKCGDPFIVEENPHIQDPDDVFPGLVIKITPSRSRKLSR
ncbi:Spore coat assembly protein [Salix suchowensis]|nr:Spore coat assembly protein [Salix suchowensis]